MPDDLDAEPDTTPADTTPHDTAPTTDTSTADTERGDTKPDVEVIRGGGDNCACRTIRDNRRRPSPLVWFTGLLALVGLVRRATR